MPKPPTALFAINHKSAFDAMEAIREAGLRIPQDISLFGFDIEVHAEHTTPDDASFAQATDGCFRDTTIVANYQLAQNTLQEQMEQR